MSTTKKSYIYNGEELTYRQLKQHFKNTSFPAERFITQDSFDPSWGVTVQVTEIADVVPTLEELKTRKLNVLETAFDSKVSGSFTCSLGYPMQFNRSDALAVQGAVMLMEANETETGYLTDAQDVTHYDVPLADIKKVLLEMLAEYARCHALKQTYRAQITACETEEALNNITFSWES